MSEFRADLSAACDEMKELLEQKRQAYGTSNLTRFGPLGSR